jgi:hypothetical protein
MFDAAQKPFHGQTKVSQLDAIGRVMAFESQHNMSRDAFDGLLTVIGSLLLEDHILPKSMYKAQKLLSALKIMYEQIHACLKGCVLFRKEYAEAKYCPKCKSSRFMEIDSGDGQKRQLDIPVTILRHLPFIPRIQCLYMIEESVKQMTWHKNSKRYNPDKMVHASDGEAWKHPGNKMGVYMEPLIDELVRAWEEGVWTYDRATKTNFKMHVWYQYSMHDLPAYGLFCTWCVDGKFPCPVCKEALRFIWLKKGDKYSSFDKHRQFLPPDHPFCLDIKNFTKGVVVTVRPPAMMIGAKIHQQIDGLVANPECGFVGYGEQHIYVDT